MQTGLRLRLRGAALVIAAIVIGCGDGGSPSEPPRGDDVDPPRGDDIAVEERLRVIDAAETLLEALLASGVAGSGLNEALATGLRPLPGVAATGVDTATSMAWARFSDGRLLIIGDNRPRGPVIDSLLTPPSPSEIATPPARTVQGARRLSVSATRPTDLLPNIAAEAETSELPTSPHVRLLHSFGKNFDQLQQPIQDMAEWFEAHGYQVRKGQEGDARVATLRNISGDGFFYFNTHGGGGLDRNGRKLYAMGSSTLVTPSNERLPEIAADLAADRLVYMTAPNGETVDGEAVSDTRYAVTRFFVEEYWSFAENSIVFVNVCHSAVAHDDIHAFIFEMHRAGAGVYLGWSGSVSATGGFRAVRYFVDRLLGANEFQPESPKQRPFAWPLVLQDMAAKGYTLDGQAQLIARPATQSGARVGLLSPSIRALWVAPPFLGNDLYIEGSFGTRPGRVTIEDGGGPVELAIKEWTPEGIIAAIPLSGSGSIGDVVVHVDDHASNPRRLHRFTGTAVYELTDAGSLKKTAEMELNTRLDPADMRFAPGEAPSRLPSWGSGHASSAAEARFRASGSYTRSSGTCTVTTTYSGGGSVATETSGTPGYSHGLWMDASGRFAFEIAFSGTADQQVQTVCDDDTSTRASTINIDIDRELRDEGAYLLEATPQMHAIGDSRTASVRSNVGAGQATARLRWTDIVPEPAYDPDQAR